MNHGSLLDNVFRSKGETTPGETTLGETTPGETTPGETTGNVDYYLKDESNKLVSSSGAAGILYRCSSGSNCNKVLEEEVETGYYYNANNALEASLPYIKCKKGSNKCWAVSATETSNDDCSTAGEGGIIGVRKGENPILYKLCLNGLEKGKVVSLSTPGKYFVSINEENVFGKSEGHYALIEIRSDGNIIKDGKVLILIIVDIFIYYI